MSLEALGFYLGVCSLAVAARLFPFMVGNVEFIHVDWSGYLSAIVCFYVLPPLGLLVVERLISLIHHGLGVGLRRCAAFGGLAVILMQAATYYEITWGLPIWAPLLFLIVLGVWRLWNTVEQAFTVAGILSPIVVGYLLYAVNLGHGQELGIAESDSQGTVMYRGSAYSGPVFLMIYDGFAIEAALDNEEKLLPRYKNLRRLAELGVWVRAATTNYDSSYLSIPSMMSGKFVSVNNRSLFPENNLLSLLDRYYILELYGLDLGYCSKLILKLCFDEVGLYSRHPEWLIKGLFLSYMRMSLPTALQRIWPWWRMNAKAMSKELSEMFIQSVEKSDLQNRFYFFHISVPHEPYVMDGAGSINVRNPIHDTFTGALVRRQDIETILGYYRQEIDFVDNHVGRLLDTLEGRGWLDSATLIVVSDHGVSWTWEHRGRTTGYINSQIARIPFFIKPHAHFRYSATRDMYEHIDLVPTVLDALGLVASARFDGASLFSGKSEVRERRAFSEGIEWKADVSGKVWRRVPGETARGQPSGLDPAR